MEIKIDKHLPATDTYDIIDNDGSYGVNVHAYIDKNVMYISQELNDLMETIIHYGKKLSIKENDIRLEIDDDICDRSDN